MNKAGKRQSNIEILRILLTIMVITVHFNSNSLTGGAFSNVKAGTVGSELLYLLEALCIVCVNGFILITGYFSYKGKTISLTKIGMLIFWVISYNWIEYSISMLLGREQLNVMTAIGKCIPNNWYVIIYLALLFVSPYVNIIIHKLSKEKLILLTVILFLIFPVWNTFWSVVSAKLGFDIVGISTVGISGDQAGYTIVNFIFLYVVGALLHKWNVLQYKKGYDFLGYIICTLIIFLGKKIGLSMWDYSNCFVVMSSVFLFNFFRKIKLNLGEFDKYILWISKACFGVYILHTKAIIEGTFWEICSFYDMNDGRVAAVVGNYIVCILATFIMCVAIDSLYRFLLSPILKMVEKKTFIINVE